MSQAHRVSFGLETCMFSAHQMHPESALRFTANAAMEALAQQDMSLQSMLQKHGLGLVIVGADVEYEGKLTFFSAITMTTETRVCLRDDGKLILFRTRHSVPNGQGISVFIRARPVKLSGGAAMDATPTAIEGELRARFAADDIESHVPPRVLQSRIDDWVSDADELGGGEQKFFIGRSDCEIAEQWQLIRLPSLVSRAREQLAFSGAHELLVGLSKPLQMFQGEFLRPMFLGDSGLVEPKAFRKGEQIYFVYRILGALVPNAPEEKRPLCGIAVEVL